eukprot:scaffold429_cov269-Pinguiococcus_pyrenoidosus.AAC.20
MTYTKRPSGASSSTAWEDNVHGSQPHSFLHQASRGHPGKSYGCTVVVDASPQLDSAVRLLRVLAEHGRPFWQVGRRSRHELKALPWPLDLRFAGVIVELSKVHQVCMDAMRQPIDADTLLRQMVGHLVK